MDKWNQPASELTIKKTIKALKENGINTFFVKNLEEAKKTALKIIPGGSEVMTNTSVTLDKSGISEEINESGKYNAVKPQLYALNRKTDNNLMQKMGAAPEWVIGSVHAITENGTVIIASNSGSNLPNNAYGAQNVVWVVGSQKIVKDLDTGMKRLYEYTLPLESERAKKAYGVSGSFVSKLLIINKENDPHRISLILVKDPVGY
jgi:L-lactate utilization protein LutB